MVLDFGLKVLFVAARMRWSGSWGVEVIKMVGGLIEGLKKTHRVY